MSTLHPSPFTLHPKLAAFKAYDIRGRMPTELNAEMAYHIGRGLAHVTGARTAVLGMDSRLSSPELLTATAAGLASMGAKVASIGLCGTEEIYHAAGAHGYDVGVVITASHNPAEYNGMKILRKGGQPFSHDVDMPALEEFTRKALEQNPAAYSAPDVPPYTMADHRTSYVHHLLGLIDISAIPPQKVVMNAGNGAAGPTAEALLARLMQVQAVKIDFEPDGTFPHGIPNPMLPENRTTTANAVKEHKASLGIAWDGDFDRCFLYDENGTFVNNYYTCALLAQALLARGPSAIVHDARLYWDTVQTIRRHGGTPHICKVGHGYYKPLMRQTDAVFGGEISGHFYFRDFFFCDTGMLPWLLILELMGKTGKTLGQLVAEHAAHTPASDEINFRITKPAPEILAAIEADYGSQQAQFERVDGLTLNFHDWRANIRTSSNEPLLRLNVEATSAATLETRLAELTRFILNQGAILSNH